MAQAFKCDGCGKLSERDWATESRYNNDFAEKHNSRSWAITVAIREVDSDLTGLHPNLCRHCLLEHIREIAEVVSNDRSWE